jgi:hypothetical protein
MQPLNTKKLHIALGQALQDIKYCKARPHKYEINMGDWVKFNHRCAVCLAGAVMVRRGLVTRADADGEGRLVDVFDNLARPKKVTRRTQRMLHALDRLRLGFVDDALWYIKSKRKRGIPPDRLVPDSTGANDEWLKAMRALQKELEAANL